MTVRARVGGGMLFLMFIILLVKKSRNSSHLSGDESWLAVVEGRMTAFIVLKRVLESRELFAIRLLKCFALSVFTRLW